ncbi:hypothetical protein KDK77_07495, partial [bacterium]|nr:hypothetical protein [bacterium]
MKKSLCYCIIVFLTLLTYANTLNNQFAYDDVSVIVENDFITSWDNLRAFFSRDYFNGAGEQSYRPLVTLSYFIDYQVWGKNPFGYHLTNLILHL